MFTPRGHSSAKKSAEVRAKSGDAAVVPKEPRRPNSVWQSLALGRSAIQTKLPVSRTGDPAEQEADRIADQVVRMPASSSPPSLSVSSVAFRQAQRMCSGREEGDEKLQCKADGATGDSVASAPPIISEALSSPGRPLDANTRAFFNPRFGSDFSEVRVHDDAGAAESARAVDALAYTVGNDIVLGAGQYRPGTMEGDSLLAHELTHVLQQSQAPIAGLVQRQVPAGSTPDVQSGDALPVDSDNRPPTIAEAFPEITFGTANWEVGSAVWEIEFNMLTISEVEQRILDSARKAILEDNKVWKRVLTGEKYKNLPEYVQFEERIHISLWGLWKEVEDLVSRINAFNESTIGSTNEWIFGLFIQVVLSPKGWDVDFVLLPYAVEPPQPRPPEPEKSQIEPMEPDVDVRRGSGFVLEYRYDENGNRTGGVVLKPSDPKKHKAWLEEQIKNPNPAAIPEPKKEE